MESQVTEWARRLRAWGLSGLAASLLEDPQALRALAAQLNEEPS